MTPMRKPRTVPRPMGISDSRHSRRDGRSSRSFGLSTWGGTSWPAVASTSAMPKSPTAIGTTPKPSPSSTMP